MTKCNIYKIFIYNVCSIYDVHMSVYIHSIYYISVCICIVFRISPDGVRVSMATGKRDRI